MWFWLLTAVILLALVALAVMRRPPLRRRGFVLIGAALLLTIGIEGMIRADVIAAERGGELMGIAVILLAGWTIWKLPRPRRGGSGQQ